jgi:hypothetical protein
MICASETPVYFQRTIQRYIPHDWTVHNHRCDNLNSFTHLNSSYNSYQDVQMRETEIRWARSIHERKELHKKVSVGRPQRRDHLEETWVDGRIILKCKLKKQHECVH